MKKVRVSAKGRYGLAALVYMAQLYKNDDYIPIIRISKALDISKIYLEQTFSLLRQAGLVKATKGPKGGYRLNKDPKLVTVYQVLVAIESSLFEKTDQTVAEQAPALEGALQAAVFQPLSQVVEEALKKVSLYDLVLESEQQRGEDNFMFII